MNEIFNTIRDNLIKSYIFYIPDTLYNDFQKTQYKDLIPYEATNTVAFLNRLGEITTNEGNFNRVEIAIKGNVLEENTFLLIDAQSKLTEIQFQFLLKKYWEHLDAHTCITNLMCEYLSIYINNASDKVINLFGLQRDAFLSHHTEINSKFNELKTKYVGQVSSNLFIEKFGIKEQNNSVPNLAHLPKVQPIKKPKPKISDTDADAFLLESVFNIKLVSGKNIAKSSKN